MTIQKTNGVYCFGTVAGEFILLDSQMAVLRGLEGAALRSAFTEQIFGSCTDKGVREILRKFLLSKEFIQLAAAIIAVDTPSDDGSIVIQRAGA